MPSIPEVRVTVSAEGPVWLSVLDHLHLALRHSQNFGPEHEVNREVARQFADVLLTKLELEGVLALGPDEAAAAARWRDEIRAPASRPARAPEIRIQVTRPPGLTPEA